MNKNDSIHPILFELIFLIKIEMKKVIKNTGGELSPGEILVLRTLVEQGEVTLQQLAQRLSMDKAQVTRLIQGLEKKELILKQRNSIDKRSFVVTAKDEVKRNIIGFIEHERIVVQQMLKGATDEEIKNMEKILELMKSNIESENFRV